jgi:DNA-binding SARP family transcriptional activator
MLDPLPSAPLLGHPPVLTLRTLGTAGLYSDGVQEPILGPGKPLALLTYLALAPGRRTSREYLVELLWADLDPERGRNALRQALFHIRKLLGEGAIPRTAELVLERPLTIDRDEFLAAVEAGDLERAVERYGGPFLPEFGAPGGAAFEHWADRERDRLQSAFLRCADLVVRRRLNESRFRDAQRLARRVRDECPSSEAAWRLVLESVIAARDFVAATVEAQALESHIDTEGGTLDAATRQLIARARQVGPAAPSGPSPSGLVAELTGREREFTALTSAWEVARGGSARHIHLSAPAGLGKTRLLRDVVARLRAGGAKVVETTGTAGDRDIPFAFAGELAAAIAMLKGAAGVAPASAATLIGLNPALSARLAGSPDSGSGEELLRRRVHALADLIHAVADEQPFVLAVDDLHWLDAASFRVLEGVLSRIADAGVLCITTARPERIPSGDRVSTMPLAPLSATQVASLVAAVGAIPADTAWGTELAADLHTASRGSPLLILETLRLALDEGILTLADGEWGCGDPPRLAALLRDEGALRRRVRGLAEDHAWLLTVLATAGAPLDIGTLARAATQPAEQTAAALTALERLGLVSYGEAGWTPAHDEIAAATRAIRSTEHLASAHRAVGAALAQSAADDTMRLARGIRHLVAGAERDATRMHFRRYVRMMRDRNDTREFVVMASDLIGTDAASGPAREMVRSLPLTWRLGLWNAPRQLLAAGVALALLAGTAAAVVTRATSTASLERLVLLDSAAVSTAVAVGPDDWTAPDLTVTPLPYATRLADAAHAFPDFPPSVSPDGRSVAWTQDTGDSTTLDIWVRTPRGDRRLTSQLRDDLVHGWAPDGSMLVGLTNRWSPPQQGNYDVAVFDTATGIARAVTTGLDHDQTPMFSPDGTRIAFVREGVDGLHRLCVVPFDGLGKPDCRLIRGNRAGLLAGWSSLNDLVLTLDSANTHPLVRYDWEHDEAARLFGTQVYAPAMSPDRRWVAASVRSDGIVGVRDWIIPVDRPSAARRIVGRSAGSRGLRWWEGPRAQDLLVDRVEFADTNHTILAGIQTRLAIRARNVGGEEIPVRAPVRWRSSDTLVAVVDSLGGVHPRAIGPVTLEASLAGWRRVSRTFEIRGAKPAVVLQEGWNTGWDQRWIAFGEPRPQVTDARDGTLALWNRGDGTYPSFVVTRQSWSAAEGLGVELRLETPITTGTWQRARSFLVPALDTAALQRGDQRRAPASQGRVDLTCGLAYPSESGLAYLNEATVLGVTTQRLALGAEAKSLSGGQWWTLRIQMFPDGRCGLAINGRVVSLSSESLPLDLTYRLRLGDESAGTRILHGALLVWTGVRTDLDWTHASR